MIAALLVFAVPAGAQEPSRSQYQPPPAGQGGSPVGQRGQTPARDSAEVREAARVAASALTVEFVLIAQLGGFGEELPADAVALLEGLSVLDFAASSDREGLVAVLEEEADPAGAEQAPIIGTIEPSASSEVVELLAPLEATQISALREGAPIGVDAGDYVRALEHLANRNGRPPAAGATQQVDLDQLPAKLLALVEQWAEMPTPTTAAPTTAAPTTSPQTSSAGDGAGVAGADTSTGDDPGDGGLRLALLAVAVALVAIGAVTAVVLLGRRRSAGHRRAGFDELLDVSRRLAAAVSPGEVEVIAVGEAVRLADAAAGAVVHRAEGTVALGFESEDGMMVVERLGDGVLRRVLDTGQQVAQVSRTEPAIRNLPVSLVATPVVAAGRVMAVVIVVREVGRPFSAQEQELLSGMAPITASSLQSARSHDAVESQSLVDPLTDVGNRRRLERDLQEVVAAADGGPTAAVMVDVDAFKEVNDTHGHQAGDELLAMVARRIRAHIRPGDEPYRYGGEEFCIVLPRTDEEGARLVAERVREAIAAEAFAVGEVGVELTKTASLGVAAAAEVEPDELIGRADRALYEAKATGRNRVVVASTLDERA